jgi:hypothetical protein
VEGEGGGEQEPGAAEVGRAGAAGGRWVGVGRDCPLPDPSLRSG